MKENQHQALDLALWRNRGAQVLSEWVTTLRDACGFEASSANLLSLKETEDLKKAFFEKLKDGAAVVRRYWPQNAFDEVVAYLCDLEAHISTMTVVLFSSMDQYIGAVKLSAEIVLIHAEAIWKVVNENLCVTTLDLQHGLCLEFNFYTEEGEYVKEGVYELITWGAFSSQKMQKFA